jgi:hypothetical protein
MNSLFKRGSSNEGETSPHSQSTDAAKILYGVLRNL